MSLGDDLISVSQQARARETVVLSLNDIHELNESIQRLMQIQQQLIAETQRIPEVFSHCPYYQSLAKELAAVDVLLSRLHKKTQ